MSAQEVKVISEYFKNTGMDDSSSDFQKKKKCYTGPKVAKCKVNKPKKKKRAKDQKDIRSAFKKNDLVSYTKDFEQVCKKSGVDVDSEQLQLAITLSKSLYETTNSNGLSEDTKSLTSKERTAKIKKTLQEYGFRVPNTKIANKRKHLNKKYKLLTVSHEEKLQNISDKYAKVLAKNINKTPTNNHLYKNDSDNEKEFYYKTTNLHYEYMKNDNIFYVTDLFEKPLLKPCLLKDWAKIPGRPLSPKREEHKIYFDDVECTQIELDIILSGSIIDAQNIVNKLLINIDNHHNTSDTAMKDNNSLICRVNESNDSMKSLVVKNGFKEEIISKALTSQSQSQVRSVSPDIFDDDVTIILDNSPERISQKTVCNSVNNFMDLTECVNASNFNKNEMNSINEVNVRKSNDLMEITECITSKFQNDKFSAQPNSHESADEAKETNIREDNLVLNLSHSSDSDSDLPLGDVHKKIERSSEKTIAICDDSESDLIPLTKSDLLNTKSNADFLSGFDTQLSESKVRNSNDNIIIKEDKKKEKSVDATIVITDDVESNLVPNTSLENSSHEDELENADEPESNNEDITQHSFIDVYNDYYDNDYYNDNYDDDYNNELNQSNKENESKKLIHSNIEITNQESCQSINNDEINSVDIDLTQNSDSSHENREKEMNQISNSLGKIDNISIDYDDLFDEVMSEASKCVSQTSFKSNTSADKICSNNSEGFEISDQELNYSLRKSRCNFDLGGISVLDNISDLKQSIRKSKTALNGSMGNYYSAKKTNPSISKVVAKSNLVSKTSTPVLSRDLIKEVQESPRNSEYIIKTNDITPMRDYASMTSPERNMELEKYGLKPFKRKRAIQLLTHLYNQTHPVVESCVTEEYSSPSKKRKYDDELEISSKSSPRKKLFSNIIPDGMKENSIYSVTKENPDVREIHCEPEDWVFQKREKTKVRSCKVPLHIAFHNYVSCRRLLREAILRYQPVNIDVIHKDLVASGYRYNPKDLLKFMDKKCITVKTVDNNARNKK